MKQSLLSKQQSWSFVTHSWTWWWLTLLNFDTTHLFSCLSFSHCHKYCAVECNALITCCWSLHLHCSSYSCLPCSLTLATNFQCSYQLRSSDGFYGCNLWFEMHFSVWRFPTVHMYLCVIECLWVTQFIWQLVECGSTWHYLQCFDIVSWVSVACLKSWSSNTKCFCWGVWPWKRRLMWSNRSHETESSWW